MNYGRDHTVSDTLNYQQLWMGAVEQGGEMATYFKAKAADSEPEFKDLPPPPMQDVFTQLEDLRMPVLGAVQGGCIGGGVDLVAACDMRYCTADAFFCIQGRSPANHRLRSQAASTS